MPTALRGLRVFLTAAAILLSLVGVATAEEIPSPAHVGYAPLQVPNACLPDSIGFRSAYEVYQRTRGNSPWSRLLLVYQRDGQAVRAHAYCVFNVDGKLWTYDQVGGSQRAWLSASEKNNALKLGRQLAAQRFVRAAWVDAML